MQVNLNVNQKPTRREVINSMPSGKGTYGGQVGRPKKKNKKKSGKKK